VPQVDKGTCRSLGSGYPRVAFAADSKRFVLALHEYQPEFGVLKLLDQDGIELAELARSEGTGFGSPLLSPDGKRVVAEESRGRIDKAGTLHVWDLTNRKRIASFPSGGMYPFRATAWSPDSTKVAALDYIGGVRIWNVETSQVLLDKKLGKAARVTRVAFSPDGRRLAVVSQPQHESEASFDPDPDPREMAQPRVFLFDVVVSKSAGPELIVCPQGFPGGLAFAPDGKTLAVGGAGAVHLFDMTGNRTRASARRR
jgi:hypothetical protein